MVKTTITAEQVREFEALLRQGLTVTQVAERTGVSSDTIYCRIHPSYADKRRKSWREYQRRKRARNG